MPQRMPQLDTAIEVVTPENIAFEYQLAGPFQRMPAYLLDGLFRLLLTFGMGLLLAGSGLWQVWGAMPLLIFHFALSWFYGAVFEALWNGQTPGKRLLRLRVVGVDGQPINALQAVARNILRSADMMPALMIASLVEALPGLYLLALIDRHVWTFQLGLVVMALTPRYQRLGDLVAGTMVVVEEPPQQHGVVAIRDPGVVELAAALPASIPVSRSLALALSAYVSRRAMFPAPRRWEIARHLGGPLCKRLQLPPSTDPDRLLCALYYRTFIEDRPIVDQRQPPVRWFPTAT
jgi:uncharacterized RDD family membrane protein YckC